MIDHDAFAVEPWVLRQTHFSAELLAQAESLFALSNGYLGLRGNLDEGEPAALHGTYLNGFYEARPILSAERGSGDPEDDQVVVNITDGKRLHLLVGGEPLDIVTGTVLAHERLLDLRAGLLVRTLRWRSPVGVELTLRSRRLVSLVHRELAAVAYEVEPAEQVRLTLYSDLVANETNPLSGDPRAAAALPEQTLLPLLDRSHDRRVVLAHETRVTRLRLAAGMDHLIEPAAIETSTCACEAAVGRFTVAATAGPGRPLRLVKLLAYHWAPGGEPEALAAACEASLDVAASLGFDGLAAAQRALLDRFWADADVELDGDPEIQQALRVSLFHLYQAAAQADGRPIPAKGLTGPGYNGHAFWDSETFVLPVLNYTAPPLARGPLEWRAATLEHARAKARGLGLAGAAFAWRTISGPECSGYLPAGIAAFHINADIADAAVRYLNSTDDHDFARRMAAPLLIETARLWMSLGFHDERRGGRFCLHGVTGPDEYTVLVDNNLYTNLMAQANLRAAADLAEQLDPASLDVQPGEIDAWRRAADAIAIPYDHELDIHLQDEQFAEHERFDFDALPAAAYPLLLHVPYLQLYRKQVVKQPDLVLAMHLRGDAFTLAEKRRNFAYYEPLTVRDSSLAACTNAVVAAELGQLELAYAYLAESALIDLHDLAENTTDGLHLAALAGSWIAAVAGLGGLRDHHGELALAPRLPPPLTRLAFTLAYRGRRLHVEIGPTQADYRLRDGAPLTIHHHGQGLRLTSDRAITVAIPAAAASRPPRQPPGREPRRPQRHSPNAR